VQKFWDIDHSIQILIQEDLRNMLAVDKSTTKSNAIKRRNNRDMFEASSTGVDELIQKL
jgi:hypothetical protein